MQKIEKIQKVLSSFAQGYTLRDQKNLEDFMTLFSDKPELLVIGTNAVFPGDDEWCQGKEEVKTLIATDWEYWGDVKFDFDNASIQLLDNIAWIVTTGSLTDTISEKSTYEGFLSFANIMINNEEDTRSDKKRTLEILALGNDLLSGLVLGEEYTWPLRFTAILALEEDRNWRFQQMQFSFATTRTPDVRI
ncbi:MAG: nuclear transport factor 2 family protein [Anaerolineaceae bacterium]|nr:nuclear transport factor 2 family protein [Anaerolineaceae bacterium]